MLFITGAGISAESGLPTYRGVAGLYTDKVTDEGIPIEEALSGRYFQANPESCWTYIRRIEEACRGATFNPAHAAIAAFEERWEVVVLTQNVDGFHRDAGSSNVIDIHGDIRTLRCTSCDYREEVSDYASLEPLPRCPDCNAIVRPAVVLFGEMLPYAKVSALEHELSQGFDIVFSIGTSSLFPYIVAPVAAAARAGIPTVEVNPESTTVTELVSVKAASKAVAFFDALNQTLTR